MFEELADLLKQPGVSSGLLSAAAALRQPTIDGFGGAITNGLLGFAQGKKNYEDDQFNKLYKNATIQKALGDANINNWALGLLNAGADPTKPQPQLIAKRPTAFTNSIPSMDEKAGQGSPSEMQVSQPYMPQQPFASLDSGLNPYAANFSQPIAANSGATVGQADTGNSAQKGFGGLPFSQRQLMALAIAKPEMAKALYDMAKDNIKGVEREEGKTYIDMTTGKEFFYPHLDKGMTYDRATNSIVPVQGYGELLARNAGLKAGAEKFAELPALMQQKAADNMQVHEFKEVMGADGKPTIVGINRAGQPVPTGLQPLPKDASKALTETQGNAVAMGTRMLQASAALNNLEDKVKPWQTKIYSYNGLGRYVGSYANKLAGQYGQAQDQWIASVLRKESGASISPGEMDNYRNIYFPQFGDSEATRQQKAAARAAVERGVLAQAGPGAALVDGIVGQPVATARAPQPTQDGVPIAGGIVSQGQAPQSAPATNPQVEALVQKIAQTARSQGHEVDENLIREEALKALGIGG